MVEKEKETRGGVRWECCCTFVNNYRSSHSLSLARTTDEREGVKAPSFTKQNKETATATIKKCTRTKNPN